MKSLLTALQEGRLIELPDQSKEKCLEYLAALIEAIPDLGDVSGITENVLAREGQHNTGIGYGWACPHGRTTGDGELLCSVGWSPRGIDYGAPDGKPVHLMVMYFVPEGQKNAYLKEISSLAKAIQTVPSMRELPEIDDLGEVRHRLLDAINFALDSGAPDARARMIQLEVKQAEAEDVVAGLPGHLASLVFALQIVSGAGGRPLVLAENLEVARRLDGFDPISSKLEEAGRATHQGFLILLRSATRYALNRTVFDCLAFRSQR